MMSFEATFQVDGASNFLFPRLPCRFEAGDGDSLRQLRVAAGHAIEADG